MTFKGYLETSKIDQVPTGECETFRAGLVTLRAKLVTIRADLVTQRA